MDIQRGLLAKIAIVVFAFTTPAWVSAQAPDPPPIFQCGMKGVPDNVPCLKDGKIVVKNSGNYVPYTPLSPDAAAALADKPSGTAPVIPKPGTPEMKPPEPAKPLAPQAASPVQSNDGSVTETQRAAPTKPATSRCHDFSSCFSQSYSQATSNRRAIASQHQENRRLAAENQREIGRFAEKTFNDMEEVRKMIGEDEASITAADPPMVKVYLQQAKDAWFALQKSYCSQAPQASYIDLDGKTQQCTQR